MFSLFFSCSSDDDGVSISQASRDLRGTWELSQIIENNTPVSEIPCSQKTEYRFNSGFTYSEDEFAGVDIDNCTIAATFNGSWENIEDDMVLRLQRAGSETAESFVITFRNNAQVFDIDISSTRTVTFQKVN
jgi:hypothetical protein